jgi:Asp-tRNA(Asn)/Glu-tRNA(Gln) amidotransferase A subunit family amidase
VKDSCVLAGEITTYGSKVYADNRSQTTHPSVQRLLDAGAIVLARSTMPEFGEAPNCYTPLWGVTRNPWNTDYGPGGSSGGAGVVLAAGMTTLADGTDIGGSIRVPAACCGVLGYKPPYGRNPNGSSATFDPYMHYGPLARTVDDIRLMQNFTAGRHVEDIGTVSERIDYFSGNPDMRGRRIAYSFDLGFLQVDRDVRENMKDSLAVLEALGCEVQEVELGWTSEIFDAWMAINASRGSAARRVPDFETWKPHLADYTVDMIQLGRSVTNDQLIRALEVHVEMYRKLGPILEQFDAFICPTNVIPSVEAERSPFDFDLKVNGEQASRATAEGWWITYPFNMLSQLPVMSVPTGFAETGVPTGMQIVGRSYDDIRVLDITSALEVAKPWAHHRPGFGPSKQSN